MHRSILSFLLLLIFASCDPGTSYKRVIANHTDNDIKFVFYSPEDHEHAKEDIFAPANTNTTIFRDGHLGGNPEPVNPMGEMDSVSVFIDNHVLKKDMTNSDNWEIKIKKHGRNYSHVYTFSIYPVDIE